MPTYDYRCDGCNHQFEVFQSITDDRLQECPQCGELKLRRLFGTGAAIVFKGSGFYQTDYRSESYKKRAAEDSKSSSGASEGKSESKSESKSDASSGGKSQSKSEGSSGGGEKGGSKAEGTG